MTERFEEGVLISIVEETDEVIVTTARGPIKARNIKRRDVTQQWCARAILDVKIKPSQFYFDTSPLRPEPHIHADPMEPRPAADIDPDQKPQPRSFITRPSDFAVHGYTKGCPSCINLSKGLGASEDGARHSLKCRDRIREARMGTTEGRARIERA